MPDRAIIKETGNEPRLGIEFPIGALARGVDGGLYVMGFYRDGDRAWVRISGTGNENSPRIYHSETHLAGYAVRLVSAEVERIP